MYPPAAAIRALLNKRYGLYKAALALKPGAHEDGAHAPLLTGTPHAEGARHGWWNRGAKSVNERAGGEKRKVQVARRGCEVGG